MGIKIFLPLILVFSLGFTNGESVLKQMEGNRILNKFVQVINKYALQHMDGELTIFAPSNDAMKRYKGEPDEQFVLNHMVNVNVKLGPETVKGGDVTRLGSMLPGSPPLYITSFNSDYYVNGAEVIMKNIKGTSGPIDGKPQMLQIIDRVLEPLTPKDRGDSLLYVDLTAAKLLKQSASLNISTYEISKFSSQVAVKNKWELFSRAGENTYFIPVNKAFDNLNKELVDENVIPGHVVLDKMLFSRPLDRSSDAEIHTATYTDTDIKVTVNVKNAGSASKPEIIVESHTVKGNRHHTRQKVIANVVKANIPVSNGIVHFIDKPLVIVKNPLLDYLKQEEDENGRLSLFAKYLRQFGGDLQDKIRDTKAATIFAPSNDAFESMTESEITELFSSEEGKTILGLHYLDQRIASDDLRISSPQNDEGMFHVPLTFPEGSERDLWLYNSNSNLFVDGVGVAAEVTEADIGATNGLIHIIDKVLGVPAQTVFQKLEQDPMLSKSFTLSKQDHFNKQLDSESQNFTFFVPSDNAWSALDHRYTSVSKILFMGEFGYQTKTLLERHLRKGEALDIESLLKLTKEEGGMTTVKGIGKLQVEKREDGLYVSYLDIEAKIIRPDMECTNGYVHVIDKVIMKRRDIVLSGAEKNVSALSMTFLAAFFARFLNR